MFNEKNKTEQEEANRVSVRDERYARLTKPAEDHVAPNFLVAAWNGVKQAFDGLHQVRRGLETVAMHTWREPTTEAYPDKAPELPPHFRGRLALTVNPDTGENLCISCRQCERVCPDKCIEITAHKSPETNKLELIDFKIDHGLCMFCGLCTEVCPTYCIINTNDFEMADYSRGALIYDLKKLTLTQEESAYYFAAKEMPLPKPKPVKAAVPAAAAGAVKPAAGAATGASAEKPAAGVTPAAAAATAAKPADSTTAVKPAVSSETKPPIVKTEGVAAPATEPGTTTAKPIASNTEQNVSVTSDAKDKTTETKPAEPKAEETSAAAIAKPETEKDKPVAATEAKSAEPAKGEAKTESKAQTNPPKAERDENKDEPGETPASN